MSKSAQRQTIVAPHSKSHLQDADCGPGQLLQIHPVDLGSAMITLGSKPFLFGREAGDLVINEKAVSRKHAEIEKSPFGFVITDLNSTNGTWVNQTKTESHILESGDKIRIGSRIFKFLSADKVESQYHEVVYSMMTRDSLTGVWNKRYLMDILQRELRRRQRTKRPLSLIMFDMDHFKQINDGHGHLVGDDILTQLCTRVLAAVREDDVLARFGGEEFCIVLSETTLAQALIVSERIRVSISEVPFQTEAGPIECTVSLGVGFIGGGDEATPSQLIQAADDKLYLAKTLGRNRIQS